MNNHPHLPFLPCLHELPPLFLPSVPTSFKNFIRRSKCQEATKRYTSFLPAFSSFCFPCSFPFFVSLFRYSLLSIFLTRSPRQEHSSRRDGVIHRSKVSTRRACCTTHDKEWGRRISADGWKQGSVRGKKEKHQEARPVSDTRSSRRVKHWEAWMHHV